MNHYPENNASHFYTKLPQTINLTGDYEVGLSEIQFTNSYSNIKEGQYWMKFRITSNGKRHKTRLAGGLYESPEYLIHVLNTFVKNSATRFKEPQGKIKFNYNRASKKISVTIHGEGSYLILSPPLQQLLGISEDTHRGPKHIDGTTIVQLHQGCCSVYVYCDLVEQRPVGDVMAPLLRIVPTMNKSSDTVHCIYEKPHYIPLSRNQFNAVEILLATDTGNPFSFAQGKTVVTLHIRRQRPEAF